LNATTIQRCGSGTRCLQAAMAIGEQQHGVTVYRHPGFFQHVLVEEFEAIQVEFDGTPGVGAE